MAAGREERWRSDKREEMRGMREQKERREDKVIEFLSVSVHPLPSQNRDPSCVKSFVSFSSDP